VTLINFNIGCDGIYATTTISLSGPEWFGVRSNSFTVDSITSPDHSTHGGS